MGKRKKKWITKNTHLPKRNQKEYEESEGWMFKIGVWFAIVAILVWIFVVVASNNHMVGYDNFIGRPIEWARSLFD